MATLSLLRFNHDHASDITDHPKDFVEALVSYMRNPNRENIEIFDLYGVKVIGHRHHEDMRWTGTAHEKFIIKHVEG